MKQSTAAKISLCVIGIFFFMLPARVNIFAGVDLPKLQKDTFNSSETCGKCHTDIHTYWSSSMHAHALSDPVFELAYLKAYKETRGEARKICLVCHAPTVLFTNDYDIEMELTKEAITCDFCHSVEGLEEKDGMFTYRLNVGETKFGPYMNTDSPVHKTKAVEFISTSEFCAGCHEFRGDNGVPIISTYSEWKAGPKSKEGIQCQDCHMPLGEEYIVTPELKKTKKRINLHNVSGRHQNQLKKAATLEIGEMKKIGTKRTISVGVTNSGSGHKIPTGTPSRVLILTVKVMDLNGQVLFTREEVFKKTLQDAEGRVLTDDTDLLLKSASIYQDNRIAPGETRYITVSFEAAEDQQYTIDARLYYRYKVKTADYQEIRVEMASDVEVR